MPPLDREKLLIAAVRAASASASGLDDREEQDALAGERFVFRFRFGCGGPAVEAPRGWTYDEQEGVVRVSFEPAQRLGETEGEEPESTSRFAVDRPWLLRATCPAQARERQEPTGEGVTLVQRFTAEESRATRLPETFRVVRKVDPAEAPRDGLDFVLAGKLEPGADGRVISCKASPSGGRPDCTISVSINTATLQDPASGTEYATWGDR